MRLSWQPAAEQCCGCVFQDDPDGGGEQGALAAQLLQLTVAAEEAQEASRGGSKKATDVYRAVLGIRELLG